MMWDVPGYMVAISFYENNKSVQLTLACPLQQRVAMPAMFQKGAGGLVLFLVELPPL